MSNLEYDNLYKFLVSLGIVLLNSLCALKSVLNESVEDLVGVDRSLVLIDLNSVTKAENRRNGRSVPLQLPDRTI